MLDHILGFFMGTPSRLVTLGQAVAMSGLGLCVSAAFGFALTTVAGVGQRPVPQTVYRSLAEAYPTLWTWWVPESALGLILAIGLVCLGWWLATTGRRLERLFR